MEVPSLCTVVETERERRGKKTVNSRLNSTEGVWWWRNKRNKDVADSTRNR
jgi:hypothetical protein